MAVSHVVDMTFERRGVAHRFNHSVKSFSDHFTLSVECGISGQTSDWDGAKGAELCLGAREILEEPLKVKKKQFN